MNEICKAGGFFWTHFGHKSFEISLNAMDAIKRKVPL